MPCLSLLGFPSSHSPIYILTLRHTCFRPSPLRRSRSCDGERGACVCGPALASVSFMGTRSSRASISHSCSVDDRNVQDPGLGSMLLFQFPVFSFLALHLILSLFSVFFPLSSLSPSVSLLPLFFLLFPPSPKIKETGGLV